jgi:hypothetical protein
MAINCLIFKVAFEAVSFWHCIDISHVSHRRLSVLCNLPRWPSLANIEHRAIEFLNAFYKEAYQNRKIVIDSRINAPISQTVSGSGDEEKDFSSNYKREVTADDMKGKEMRFPQSLIVILFK